MSVRMSDRRIILNTLYLCAYQTAARGLYLYIIRLHVYRISLLLPNRNTFLAAPYDVQKGAELLYKAVYKCNTNKQCGARNVDVIATIKKKGRFKVAVHCTSSRKSKFAIIKVVAEQAHPLYAHISAHSNRVSRALRRTVVVPR